MQEEDAQNILGQIMSAIKHCHNLDIVHGDVSPQHTLQDADRKMKLRDVGLSTKPR